MASVLLIAQCIRLEYVDPKSVQVNFCKPTIRSLKMFGMPGKEVFSYKVT